MLRMRTALGTALLATTLLIAGCDDADHRAPDAGPLPPASGVPVPAPRPEAADPDTTETPGVTATITKPAEPAEIPGVASAPCACPITGAPDPNEIPGVSPAAVPPEPTETPGVTTDPEPTTTPVPEPSPVDPPEPGPEPGP